MTKKEITQKKEELCELHTQAIKTFKDLFEEKSKNLKNKKNGKKPKS